MIDADFFFFLNGKVKEGNNNLISYLIRHCVNQNALFSSFIFAIRLVVRHIVPKRNKQKYHSNSWISIHAFLDNFFFLRITTRFKVEPYDWPDAASFIIAISA